jgi:hypothetical protein
LGSGSAWVKKAIYDNVIRVKPLTRCFPKRFNVSGIKNIPEHAQLAFSLCDFSKDLAGLACDLLIIINDTSLLPLSKWQWRGG